MFGYLNGLKKHKLVLCWLEFLGQSYREEETVRKERASEIYLGGSISLSDFLLFANEVGVKS